MATTEVLRETGGDPERELARDCASFYLLERMAADGIPGAAAELATFEAILAKELASYLSLACGGELRHGLGSYTNPDRYCSECGGDGSWSCYECGGEGRYYCEECDGSGMVDVVADCDCGEDDCDGAEEVSEDCESCDGAGWYECYTCHGEGGGYCDDCGGEGVESGRDLDDAAERAEATLRASGMAPALAEALAEWMAEHSSMNGNGRTGGWRAWLAFAAEHGTGKAADVAWHAFRDLPWIAGYGGAAWATAARLTADYLNGRTTARVFLNIAWSLQHNGGAIFDKAYSGMGELQATLVDQAAGRYGKLATVAYASHARLWRYYSYLQSTAAGRRHLAEQAEYRNELIMRGVRV